MASEARFDERHHHGNLHGVVITALPVETDKGAATADGFLNVDIRVDEVAQGDRRRRAPV